MWWSEGVLVICILMNGPCQEYSTRVTEANSEWYLLFKSDQSDQSLSNYKKKEGHVTGNPSKTGNAWYKVSAGITTTTIKKSKSQE